MRAKRTTPKCHLKGQDDRIDDHKSRIVVLFSQAKRGGATNRQSRQTTNPIFPSLSPVSHSDPTPKPLSSQTSFSVQFIPLSCYTSVSHPPISPPTPTSLSLFMSIFLFLFCYTSVSLPTFFDEFPAPMGSEDSVVDSDSIHDKD